MAKLSYGSLALEIKYKSYEAEWVVYDVGFLWQDKSLINDKILKRSGSFWKVREKGKFVAENYEFCELVPLLQNVLETDEPHYWEPLEPDMIVAVYPGLYFPFLRSHWQVAYEREDVKEARQQREIEKFIKEKLPDDLFQVICFIDNYNFKDGSGYSGDGIALHPKVFRKALEQFCIDLSAEYEEFKEKFKVGEPVIYDEDFGEIHDRLYEIGEIIGID